MAGDWGRRGRPTCANLCLWVGPSCGKQSAGLAPGTKCSGKVVRRGRRSAHPYPNRLPVRSMCHTPAQPPFRQRSTAHQSAQSLLVGHHPTPTPGLSPLLLLHVGSPPTRPVCSRSWGSPVQPARSTGATHTLLWCACWDPHHPGCRGTCAWGVAGAGAAAGHPRAALRGGRVLW